jgi:hypothetical protein
MAGERLTSTASWLEPLRALFPVTSERTDAAVTSETPIQQMLRALVRFWWVAIVGILLAGVVFVFATYNVELGVPPKLNARSQPTYSASTQLLITSKGEPYLSSSNTSARIVDLGDTTTTDTQGTTTGTQQSSTYDSGGGPDGDLQRLVEIANSLPPRVTSDTVIRARNKDYRRIDGSVTAVNPYAFSGAGGFRSGPLPYIKITGTAKSQQDAIDITNQTALAFITWFKSRQISNKVPVKNRVLVEQVNSAEHAAATGGTKPLLGVGAAVLVLLGAAGFALALERLIPRRSRAAQRGVSAPAPVPAAAAAPAASQERERVIITTTSEPELPALEVPTMTFGAQIEESANGVEKTKPVPRPRKSTANGNGAAPKRRRTTTSTPRATPSSDDAS